VTVAVGAAATWVAVGQLDGLPTIGCICAGCVGTGKRDVVAVDALVSPELVPGRLAVGIVACLDLFLQVFLRRNVTDGSTVVESLLRLIFR
jgi:hypothetical protein